MNDEDTMHTLVAARVLITDEKSWTRIDYARGKRGMVVDYHSPEAESWCAVGALFYG